MQVFTNIASQFVPFYGDMTPATKAERARAHAERVRVVEASQAAISKLRGTAPQRATAAPATAARSRQARLNRESHQILADNPAHREQAKVAMLDEKARLNHESRQILAARSRN